MMSYKKNIIMKIIFGVILISLLGSVSLSAQYVPSNERSSFQERKKSIMDGNRLRATYHNTGHAGRTAGQNTDELLFEFPRNTGRTYMYFMSVVFGAEVEDQSVNDGTRFPIVNVSDFRQSGTGRSWSMNPITGYSRSDSQEMARSDRGPTSVIGNTWPNVWPDKLQDGGDGWAGSWNGFFGRDQFNADVEFYYKAGDDLYDRYSNTGRFVPDSSDPSRGGLGIIMETRILAWSQPLIEDVHFNLFEIVNDSDFDYPKVGFGLWIADLITGADDQPEFDDLRSIAYLTTLRRTPAPVQFGGPIGEMGLQFLETPGNAIDGIDNDGDSDTYNPNDGTFYNPDNEDLYTPLTVAGGGFFSLDSLVNDVIPRFVAEDFDPRTICEGDKIVRILNNGSRVIDVYPVGGGAIQTRGGVVNLNAGCTTLVEDNLPPADPNFGVHIDQIDNNLNGLIDENRPNHLEKVTFFGGVFQQRAVRYINYLNFEVGDTLQRGLIVPNRVIRERMDTDPDFKMLIDDYRDMLYNIHGSRVPAGFFDNYYRTYHTSAPMIDEARDDYFDNDRDWIASADDVGIEGNRDVPSLGAGDGFPTSGAGTSFPGEPNIDKTDVSESDMIGVSRATFFNAGSFPLTQDVSIWLNRLIPGEFDRVSPEGVDTDLFVSSSIFPLAQGQRERFAVAITAAQTFSAVRQDDRDKTNSNLQQAFNAYEADYQFAVAPNPPIVSAVAGDGRVTLYWDDSAEESFDRYIERITGNGFDFEGYRVYRSTDDAFEDARTITDGQGNTQFNRPLAIYDRNNGIRGYHPVPVNGVQYFMGNDSGLQYSYVDSNVTNGRLYFYAVTSFDFGAEIAGIAPSESPIQISRNPDGSVVFGQNVLQIRPSASQAGYITPENPAASRVAGSPAGDVFVDIIDPTKLKQDNIYSVVFEDTLIVTPNPNLPDTVKTKNFSLINITGGAQDTLLNKSVLFNGEDIPVIDGFKLRVINETSQGINQTLSGWTENGTHTTHNFQFTPANTRLNLADYSIVIGNELGFGQSSNKQVERLPGVFTNYPSIPTNFRVYNRSTGEEIEFAYNPATRNPGTCQFVPAPGPPGMLSAFRRTGGGLCSGSLSDNIYFIEDFRGEQDATTYVTRFTVINNQQGQTISLNPQPGDSLSITLNKPFIEGDEFQFRFDEGNMPRVDNEVAKSELDNIRVVPNPYIVTSPYEPRITTTNRQQQRELHFTRLPIPSTLRIFTVSGYLIREIQIGEGNTRRAGGEYGGTYVWDMLTRDNLEISYGVYLFHVQAPGVGEKTGKFAVIK